MNKIILFCITLLLVIPVLAETDSPNQTCKDHLTAVSVVLDKYHRDHQTYPANLEPLKSELSSSLELECNLTRLPYRYESLTTEGEASYKIMCLGRAHYENGQRWDYYAAPLQTPTAYEGPPLAIDIQERLDREFQDRRGSKFWGNYGEITILLLAVLGVAVFLKLLGFVVAWRRSSEKGSVDEASS